MELKYGFISTDDHVLESPAVWTARLSKAKFGERIPHIERSPDGRDAWIIEGRPIPLTGSAVGDGPICVSEHALKRCDEVPAILYDACERLRAMDRDGVDYSILYPSVSGFAGETFGRLADPDLETACIQAYNDWLIDEWAAVSPRLVPQCIAPIWPMERTVAEIKRAVAKGHRGVIYPASPMELRSVPHINEPAYEPLWAICQDLGVPLCF